MNWKTHRAQLLKDPEVRKALQEGELEYQIARALIKARIDRGLTQKQLAHKLKTKQSVVSRMENAGTVPSLSSLKRFADILGFSLNVQFNAR